MYDRDALLAAVDLPSLADTLLGGHAGQGRSPMWHCPNPDHAQTGRTPPVSIFHSHQGQQRWRCHGCGEGGSAIDLVLICRGGSIREAFDYLASRVGHHDHGIDWTPAATRPLAASGPPGICPDPEGLRRDVEDCARNLFTPEASHLREWLTRTRRIPAELLGENRIGGDLGPRRQTRPDGMPGVGGVVLPAIMRGEVVYAQIRVPNPDADRPRYLNPTTAFAPNPKLTRIRPVHCTQPEVIVTEGVMDALSAAAAGYRAVGLLSAAYCDDAVALALSRIRHPLVLALDGDDAGQAAMNRLTVMLKAHNRTPTHLELPADSDLNDTMSQAPAWGTELPERIAYAKTQCRSVSDGLSR